MSNVQGTAKNIQNGSAIFQKCLNQSCQATDFFNHGNLAINFLIMC